MLYGSDYRSVDDREEARLVRRFRRDVMFVAARPQEVIAAGLVAGLAIVPLLLGAGALLTFFFSVVFSGVASRGPLPPAGAPVAQTPTSRADLILAVVVIAAALALAGGLSAALRRYDYRKRGGLRGCLDHPRSLIGLLGFFIPVVFMTIGSLLLKAAESPHPRRAALVAAPSMLDRAVLYAFFGLVAAMLLYMVWESCFPRILPTLSDLDVDAEVGRYQREERARVAREEDGLRARATGLPQKW